MSFNKMSLLKSVANQNASHAQMTPGKSKSPFALLYNHRNLKEFLNFSLRLYTFIWPFQSNF